VLCAPTASAAFSWVEEFVQAAFPGVFLSGNYHRDLKEKKASSNKILLLVVVIGGLKLKWPL
jgi:hypothetical protein